jgi:hypothetical protein
MLAFLPIIGPIIQGIVSIFTKTMDTKVAVLKTTREADVQEGQVSEQIIHDTQDDIGIRLMRDLVCFPVVLWSFLIGWDTIIANTSFKDWMWHVANYPDSVSYLPYAVLVFLLGNIGINMWARK